MIVFRDVSKKYGKRTVLNGVSFSVHPGEFVCITGPSGAGKSTIVHLAIRAEIPTSGKIEVDGKDLHTLPRPILQLYRRRTGVVFQDYKLLSDRNIGQNIAFALEACGDSNRYIKERVPMILERVGLKGRHDSFPDELSGGEKARAALARALAHNPMIVIADEPTGNIDPKQSLEILHLLKEVNKQGVTILLATHDMLIVDELQTRVLRLENGTIVRDTVGGYDHGRAYKEMPAEKPHNLLTPEPEGVITSKKANGNGPRTVKPIAIND